MLKTSPLKLAKKTYKHGLGTHSTSVIRVRLSKPAKAFLAEAGIDNNWDTQGTHGSVVFAVEVDGKEAYRSGIRRGSDQPLPVQIELDGAKDFTLRVFDGGDGPTHDQADWADACVVYEDGTREYLDELPTIGNETTFSTGLPFSFVYDGKPSTEFLKTWKRNDTTEILADGRIRRVLVFTDPKTGLEVTCTATEFTEFPTCEWTLAFKNTGTADTPILENIQAADLSVTRATRVRVPVALFVRYRFHADGLRAPGDGVEKGKQTGLCAKRRTSHQWRVALLQRAMGRSRGHSGHRLGRTMGVGIHTRRRKDSPVQRGTTVDPLQAAPGRAGPCAPHYRPVLEGGRLDRRTKCVAAVDEGP